MQSELQFQGGQRIGRQLLAEYGDRASRFSSDVIPHSFDVLAKRKHESNGVGDVAFLATLKE